MAWSVDSTMGEPVRAVCERHAEARADFLQRGALKPGFAARRGHALDAAAPLLDQAERVEDAADHAVAQLGNPARQVVDRQAEGQETRVLDLEPVVEDGRDGSARRAARSRRAPRR